MTPNEIVQTLQNKFNDKIIESNLEVIQPYVVVQADSVADIFTYLKNDPALEMDYLDLLTGVDWLTENRIEMVYHVSSIKHHHSLVVKTNLDRETPKVPSITPLYGAANWHERETYDLFGIIFVGHPDLRRILLPDDWKGHPLRKDYQFPEEYHGVKWN